MLAEELYVGLLRELRLGETGGVPGAAAGQTTH
jgi:hypothetical protein